MNRTPTPIRVYAPVLALHIIGLALLATAGPAAAALAGMAVFAYARGLIHAFDLDHVSMIDNTTRKFLADGNRYHGTGFAFSAGHSTIVLAACVAVAAGATAIRDLLDGNSPASTYLTLFGLTIAGTYLAVAAAANTSTLTRTIRLIRERTLDPTIPVNTDTLRPQGLAARALAAPMRHITRPGHVYIAGLLFGLGFDTASQIGLLVLTASAATLGVHPITLMCLPILFAAAMTLGDTTNGILMLRVYGNASTNPDKALRFNATVTSISITSAIAVAVLCAINIANLAGAAWAARLAETDTTWAGPLLAGGFAVTAIILYATRPGPTVTLGNT